MAGRADLTKAAKAVKGKTSFHWVDTADHGYRPLKASGLTVDDVLAEVAATTVAWVAQLDG
jgi:predicted alpha/beta-hydrolase family hydrolase